MNDVEERVRKIIEENNTLDSVKIISKVMRNLASRNTNLLGDPLSGNYDSIIEFEIDCQINLFNKGYLN